MGWSFRRKNKAEVDGEEECVREREEEEGGEDSV